MKELIKKLLAARGYRSHASFDPDVEREFIELAERIAPHTMTSRERQYALYKAVSYVLDTHLAGDFVECGVWKGGSAMLIASLLKARGVDDRNLYLYDTFAGMSAPTEKDVNVHGVAAGAKWSSLQGEGVNLWDYSSLEEVKANIESTGYPGTRVTYVKGPVEETLPGTLPGSIALLRLDTDWYESTKHELVHLFPLLVPGGILIIDDYGHWQGARRAVDEYFKETGHRIFLNRIDYTGRIAVKAS